LTDTAAVNIGQVGQVHWCPHPSPLKMTPGEDQTLSASWLQHKGATISPSTDWSVVNDMPHTEQRNS
jgi:hypothetical protein